jgi:hypothetical protein
MDTHVIQVFGDKTKKKEPSEHRIEFPGGFIYVARTDQGYWAHIGVYRRKQDVLEATGDDAQPTAKITDARLDCYDKHAAALCRHVQPILDEAETANHFAVRIELDPRYRRCSHRGCNVPATRKGTFTADGVPRDGYTCGNHEEDKPKGGE